MISTAPRGKPAAMSVWEKGENAPRDRARWLDQINWRFFGSRLQSLDYLDRQAETEVVRSFRDGDLYLVHRSFRTGAICDRIYAIDVLRKHHSR